MSRLFGLCLAALSCLVVPLASAVPAQDGGEMELYFRAQVVIDAGGSIGAIAWELERRIPEALGEKLERQIRTWQFEPGSVDGKPVETRTTLQLRLTATPTDGGDAYEVRVDHAQTGPSLARSTFPGYPPKALRHGAMARVVADLRVEADGSRNIALLQYDGRREYRKAFEKATTDYLDQVEVAFEQVGGHAVDAGFVVPVTFCLNGPCHTDPVPGTDRGSSLPTAAFAPGEPLPQGSVARLLTDVRGTAI